MGHKVHPYGFRLGVSRTWTAKWYADKEYTALVKEDIAIRKLVEREPTHVQYRGLDVYGMGPSSSGGITVGEALNILRRFDLDSVLGRRRA